MAKENTSVKVMWASMFGAGVASSGAGGMVAFLDKVLVNGFNTKTADSVVISNNVATVTVSSGHGYSNGVVIVMSGATPAGLNTEWRISSVPSPSTFTFTTEGLSDQTATGTITMKVAPVGWEKAFSGTNDATYRSYETDTPRTFYRFDDTSTDPRNVILHAATSMSSYNDTSGDWYSSTNLNRPVSNWIVVGDSRTVYIFTYEATYGRLHPMCFGAFISFKPNDVTNDLAFMGGSSGGNSAWYDGNQTMVCARVRSAADGTVYFAKGHRVIGACSGSNAATYDYPVFPSPVDEGMILADHLIREQSGSGGDPVRGKMRGSFWVCSNEPYSSQLNDSRNSGAWPGVFIEGVSGLEGRRLLMTGVPRYGDSNYTTRSRACFDIVGPWEY